MLFDNEVENQNQLVKQFDNKINCASVANASINKNIYLVESFFMHILNSLQCLVSLSIVCVFQVLI